MGRVLLVEDEILARYPVAEWLRGEGHEIVEAASANEALAILASRIDINLVLTDVRMPGSMSGLDLTVHIRTGSRPVPVIVMSGDALASDATAAGASAFFRKPFDFGELAARVAALLGDQGSGNRSSTAVC